MWLAAGSSAKSNVRFEEAAAGACEFAAETSPSASLSLRRAGA